MTSSSNLVPRVSFSLVSGRGMESKTLTRPLLLTREKVLASIKSHKTFMFHFKSKLPVLTLHEINFILRGRRFRFQSSQFKEIRKKNNQANNQTNNKQITGPLLRRGDKRRTTAKELQLEDRSQGRKGGGATGNHDLQNSSSSRGFLPSLN